MLARVRTLASLALIATACGSPREAPHDAAIDATIDATVPLPVCGSPVAGTTVTLRPIADVGETAVLVTSPPGDPRLFVVAQRGVIRIIEDGALRPTPFLDLSAEHGGPVIAGDELGLLGLAFDPDYA